MTRITAVLAFVCIILGVAVPVLAQPTDSVDHLQSGRASMAAGDPAGAIRHFEHADTREAREWLAVALMTESRSSSDQYVERAFDAAMRARTESPSPTPSRAALAAAMRPGEMVIAFLFGETSAWAWAFDRDAFIGYPLPSRAAIETAASRGRAYIESGDREGIERIAEDLMPALLGPALNRQPTLTRLIFVVDGPLKGLQIGAFPAGDERSPLQQQLSVSVVEYGALLETIRAEPSPLAAQDAAWQHRTIVLAATAMVLLLLAGVAVYVRRKR